jgi:hypothetical protein
MTVEKLIELLLKYPKDMKVAYYCERMDSVYDLYSVEEYEGEVNLRS